MVKTDVVRNRAKVTVLVAGLACCAAAIQADGPGHSFTSLTSPFTQELYAVTAGPVGSTADGFAGGLAFAPDGDVWDAECFGSQYHRFDRQGTVPDGHGGSVRQESLVDVSTYAPAPVGCGIVNLPQPYLGITAVMANTQTGLWPLDADSGLPILGGPLNSASVHAGNGRGIDIDPASSPTNNVVYAGADCDPTLRAATTCTLWDYDTTLGSTLGFARFHRAATESIESLYFSPDGNHVLMSYRDSGMGAQGLIAIGRRATLISSRSYVDDTQVIGRIAMRSMPQGIAFRTAGDFAVTLNEDGTMMKLTFPSGDFSQAPTQSLFASGGFLGGMLRVGADGCIYAPQSRLPGGASGVRFGDNAVGSSDSVARICGGFAPAPGVADAVWSPEPGSLSGSAFEDWNRNGLRDGSEPGLSGVPILAQRVQQRLCRHGRQRWLHTTQCRSRFRTRSVLRSPSAACRATRRLLRLNSARASSAPELTFHTRSRRRLCARQQLHRDLRRGPISLCETAAACVESSCGRSPTSRSPCAGVRQWTARSPSTSQRSRPAT